MTDDARPPRDGMPRPRLARRRAPALALRRWSTCSCCPLGAAIALVWVNAAPESYYRFTYAISFAVNDVAMVFFFALMTKEVVEATAPGGVLHPWRRALLPVVASIGATVVPALIYVRVVGVLDEPMLAVGMAGVPGDRSGRQLLRRATDLPAASRDPVSPAARDRLRRPRLRGAGAVQSDTRTFISRSALSCWLSRWALPRAATARGQELLAVSDRRRRPVLVRPVTGAACIRRSP